MEPPQVESLLDSYITALFDTDKSRALAVIDSALAEGIPPETIIFRMVIPGIERMIGGMLADEMVTLSQHFLASQIAEEVTARLIPLFTAAPEAQGTIILGTSYGDFHGLGKKIVGGCLKARFFTVHDIGINVSPERFIQEAVSRDADVIGVSSMMVHTATGEMGPRAVRRLLREKGLEERIRLIVGGAPYRFHPELYREVGADAWEETAADAPDVIKQLVGKERSS